MAEYKYRVPARNGEPEVDLPDFTIKTKDGKIKGTHVKSWSVFPSYIEIVTDKEYKELEKYKV